jgi:hypothetical protein
MFLRLAVVVVSIFSTVVWSASDDQEPSLIFLPPRPEFNGTKLIPGTSLRLCHHEELIDGASTDAAHPFIAPGPGDQRGPCRKFLRARLIGARADNSASCAEHAS